MSERQIDYRIVTVRVQSPGKWVFLVAVLMNVVGTLLSPILASISHWWASRTTSSLVRTNWKLFSFWQGLWSVPVSLRVLAVESPFQVPGFIALQIFNQNHLFCFFVSALNVVISAWAPPQERFKKRDEVIISIIFRSTLSSIAFSGASLGTVLSMLSRFT